MPQLSIQLHALRLAGTLHGFAELPDDRLLLHLDQSLIALHSRHLQTFSNRRPVDLAPPGPGTLLAEDLQVDDAFAYDPRSRRVLVAHGHEFLRIDPTTSYNPERIPFPGINRGTFAAAIDPQSGGGGGGGGEGGSGGGGGPRILLVIARAVTFDFAHYALLLADLHTGKTLEEKSIASTGTLELFWHDHAWFIGDSLKGVLWRWDTQSPAQRLGPPPAGTLAAPVTFTMTPEGPTLSALITKPDSALHLLHARAEKDHLTWAAPIPVKEAPLPTFARRHPTRPLWACLADTPTGQHLQLRDPSAKILTSTLLPPGIAFQNLLWSPHPPPHPTHLYATAPRALAQLTLSE